MHYVYIYVLVSNVSTKQQAGMVKARMCNNSRTPTSPGPRSQTGDPINLAESRRSTQLLGVHRGYTKSTHHYTPPLAACSIRQECSQELCTQSKSTHTRIKQITFPAGHGHPPAAPCEMKVRNEVTSHPRFHLDAVSIKSIEITSPFRVPERVRRV